MKSHKKLVAMLLVVVLMISTCASALASTITLGPGKSIPASKRPIYAISSSPSYTISVTGKKGYKVTVYLDLYDSYETDSTLQWKKSATKTITCKNNVSVSATISPTKTFKFVSGRTTKARLRFTAAKANKGDVNVTYPTP